MFDLNIEDGILRSDPVQFHPYISFVYNKIVEIENLTGFYQSTKTLLIEHFNANGIKAWEDNKIVFEVDMDGVKIYYGFYDWRLSIGLSCSNKS